MSYCSKRNNQKEKWLTYSQCAKRSVQYVQKEIWKRLSDYLIFDNTIEMQDSFKRILQAEFLQKFNVTQSKALG
jgi:hypothetical protein